VFLAMLVGSRLEDNSARELLHRPEFLAQGPVIVDRRFKLHELLSRQGDRHGFLSDLAGPLVTGTSAAACGAVLHGALADVTEVAQGLAQLLVLALQVNDPESFSGHGCNHSLTVKP
jgi:hypothetical protein